MSSWLLLNTINLCFIQFTLFFTSEKEKARKIREPEKETPHLNLGICHWLFLLEMNILFFFLFFGLIERRKSVEITQVKPTHPNRCLQAFNAALWAPNSSWRKELSLENVDMVRAVDFKPTCTCSWLIYKRAREKIWEEKYVDSFQT